MRSPAPYAIPLAQIHSSAHRRLLVVTAEMMGVMPSEIIGQSRERRLVKARWAIMRTLRRRGWSTPQIGRALGNRDHSTVVHGLAEAEALAGCDAAFRGLCVMAEGLM